MRAGVCYVGLVYKNIPNDPNDHACCAAQMFLSEGDGVVFRGANGPWKTGDYEFHLKPDAAKDLIRKVLTTYAELHAGPPTELFIHGQTSFNDEEWQAFEEVAPAETNVVGVRIRTTNGEAKLFRDGDYPVLRGTALILDEKNAYLWTTGYVPQLDTYIGPETPNPLFITVLKSKKTMPELKTVLNDIMGLTKINYNSCTLTTAFPSPFDLRIWSAKCSQWDQHKGPSGSRSNITSEQSQPSAETEQSDPLQAIGPTRDLLENLVECRRGAVVKRTRILVSLCVGPAGCFVAQDEGFVLRDVLIVAAPEALRLVRLVGFGADERFHFGALKQAVDIVVMAHEIDRAIL